MSRSSVIPNKTDAPLVIDPDRMLTLTVCLQRFEPVAWRNPEIGQHSRLIEQAQLPQGCILNKAAF
jgi:hypothetical protein